MDFINTSILLLEYTREVIIKISTYIDINNIPKPSVAVLVVLMRLKYEASQVC